MPSIDILIAFFLATAVFAYIPGPAMLYAAAQTMALGRRAGWLAALGIHIGGYVHVFAAAFGLALVFAAVPILYLVLKIGGAAYLIWLGAKLILSPTPAQIEAQDMPSRTPARAFWQSVTVEVLNPKTALFFLAFLPQFTDPAAALPIWAQLLILGTIVNAMFSSADILVVILAGKVTGYLKNSPSAGRMTARLGGTLLIGLGLRVALSRA